MKNNMKSECRLCKSENLYQFLDLGYHPHSDQFRETNNESETRYPLKLLMCRDCGAAQISYTVEKEVMFTKDYMYQSSITETAKRHWKELVEDVVKTTGIIEGTTVDIGGNDGTLSLEFKEKGFEVLNIDPCKEVSDISRERGVPTITDFFNKDLADKIGKIDIITGTNVFAHIHDHDEFIKTLLKIMKDDSVFIFESPYFGEFLKGLEYDTVYHQHLLYLSLRPVIKFLGKYGLEVFDVRFTPLHGGAFRCYIAKKSSYKVKPIVAEILGKENWKESQLIEWGKKCKKHRDELFDLIYSLYKKGKKICCVSAPAKGMTLLNYTGIGRFISFITEKSKLKIGKYTPGTKIKIVGDEELVNADVAILLAWNFADEIIKNNSNYKGIWIIPLPIICQKTNEE